MSKLMFAGISLWLCAIFSVIIAAKTETLGNELFALGHALAAIVVCTVVMLKDTPNV